MEFSSCIINRATRYYALKTQQMPNRPSVQREAKHRRCEVQRSPQVVQRRSHSIQSSLFLQDYPSPLAHQRLFI